MNSVLTRAVYITGVSTDFISELPSDSSVMKNDCSATIDIQKAVEIQSESIKHISKVMPMFRKNEADLVFVTIENKTFRPLSA